MGWEEAGDGGGGGRRFRAAGGLHLSGASDPSAPVAFPPGANCKGTWSPEPRPPRRGARTAPALSPHSSSCVISDSYLTSLISAFTCKMEIVRPRGDGRERRGEKLGKGQMQAKKSLTERTFSLRFLSSSGRLLPKLRELPGALLSLPTGDPK